MNKEIDQKLINVILIRFSLNVKSHKFESGRKYF